MVQKDKTSQPLIKRESILIRYIEYVVGRGFEEDKLNAFSRDTGSQESAADFRFQQKNPHTSETGEIEINIRLDPDVVLIDDQQFWENPHLSEAAAHLDMSA
jgi:hypothetical protein